MQNRKCPYRTMVAVAIVVCVTLSGCASPKELWYQEGKGQVDYDRDAQECTIIAGEFARQATISGASEDPAAFQQAMMNCLSSKGWSMAAPKPSAAGAGSSPLGGSEPLAVVDRGSVQSPLAPDGERIQAFGAQITLPAGFSLAATTNSGFGPTIVQTYLFSGPQETFVNVMVQRAVAKANRFAYTPYLVRAPFFLYEQGRQGTIFCGKMNGQWVMGLGRYLLVNDKERITLIVTRSLAAPQTEPEAGFQLSREQFAIVEGFKKEWLAWLPANVTVPSQPWWSRLPLFWR